MPRKPTIFIGSSTEGLTYAKSLHVQLMNEGCEPTLWDQNSFELSKSTLESLVEKAHAVDFAALVLTPDDLVTRRGDERPAARDNVLFEAGLFMGTLGRERTFLVSSKDRELALPSDFAGITQAHWGDRDDGEWDQALLAPASQIVRAMKAARRLGAKEETVIDYRNGVVIGAWTVEERDGGDGEITADGHNIMRVERPNKQGSLWLWLKQRIAPGDRGETVTFHISGDAWTSDGEHTLVVVVKEDGSEMGTHLHDERKRVGNRWQSLDATVDLRMKRPCRIRIEDRSVSEAPSAALIQDLVITVTRYPFDLKP
jgi:hypothetical protein